MSENSVIMTKTKIGKIWSAFAAGVLEAGGDAGITYDDNPDSELSQAYDQGRNAGENLTSEWREWLATRCEPALRELVDDVWGEADDFPKRDWQTECENDETHVGYWEWVESMRDMAGSEEEGEDE